MANKPLEIRKSEEMKDMRRPTILKQIREIQSSHYSSGENQAITESLEESSLSNEGSSINTEQQEKIEEAKKAQARNSSIR